MTDLANEPDAPQRLRQDMRVLMSWFGIKSLDDWNAVTLDEKREYHEKFARGFERYMREGPSIKLMRIFHSFMRWLKTVYSAVKSLNVDLTDDVREVMDRMLASDAEIRNAKAVMKLANAFTTRESFPGTDEEWHEWQRRIQDEDEFAAARLTAQLVDERMFLEKKTQEYAEKFADEDRAWAEAYKEAYAEAIDKIRKEPLFKMRKAFFGDGEQGGLPYPLLRSDTEGLESEQIEALDKLGVLSDTGYPIETVARQFGYDNELDFIRDVILMGPVTEEIAARQAAEAAVKKEFGTRMNAEKIRKLAREAAMNDLVVERLNKELSLMKAIKKDPVVLQAAKTRAESTVSAIQVKDLSTASFRSAMEKYERALARGDAQTAYEAKRAQLFNAAALRAVDESLRRVEHLVKEVKRTGVRYRRVLRKEQDAGYLDQILNLAGKYGIRDEHKPRESFTKFAESMEEYQ